MEHNQTLIAVYHNTENTIKMYYLHGMPQGTHSELSFMSHITRHTIRIITYVSYHMEYNQQHHLCIILKGTQSRSSPVYHILHKTRSSPVCLFLFTENTMGTITCVSYQKEPKLGLSHM